MVQLEWLESNNKSNCTYRKMTTHTIKARRNNAAELAHAIMQSLQQSFGTWEHGHEVRDRS